MYGICTALICCSIACGSTLFNHLLADTGVLHCNLKWQNFGNCGISLQPLHLCLCPLSNGMPKDMGNKCCIRTGWKCGAIPPPPPLHRLAINSSQCSKCSPPGTTFIGRDLLEGGSMPWNRRYPQGLCTWFIFI